MRVVMLEADERLLDERRRLGLDGQDEMWEGELHMVSPAGGPHQRLSGRVLAALLPVADRLDMAMSHETGRFAEADDYRVPDLVVARPEHLTERGVDDRAEVVFEFRSPNDETTAKLPWYAQRVTEIVAITPGTRAIELYRSVDGHALPVAADADGVLTLETLGVRLSTADTADGPRLAIDVDGDVTHC